MHVVEQRRLVPVLGKNVVEALADQVGGDPVAGHLAHGVFQEGKTAELRELVEQQQEPVQLAPAAAVEMLVLHQAVDGLARKRGKTPGEIADMVEAAKPGPAKQFK